MTLKTALRKLQSAGIEKITDTLEQEHNITDLISAGDSIEVHINTDTCEIYTYDDYNDENIIPIYTW